MAADSNILSSHRNTKYSELRDFPQFILLAAFDLLNKTLNRICEFNLTLFNMERSILVVIVLLFTFVNA